MIFYPNIFPSKHMIFYSGVMFTFWKNEKCNKCRTQITTNIKHKSATNVEHKSTTNVEHKATNLSAKIRPILYYASLY